MKKSFILFGLVLGLMSVTSCGDDNDAAPGNQAPETPETPTFADTYFSIEGGTYNDAQMPEATSEAELDNVVFNSQALSGGTNIFVIQTEQPMQEFYVGVAGQSGYYTVPAYAQDNLRSGGYSYLINLLYGSEVSSGNMQTVLSGRDLDGLVLRPRTLNVEFVETFKGALEINLTFSNAKDIDLHLFTPSGNHIYYGNRGFDVMNENGEVVERYGLDKDSNPSCNIDNLNNENIVIPSRFVENGEYTVKIDLYENCNRSIETLWNIVARYNNNLIVPTSGSNPASGVYEIDAPSSYNSNNETVMTFTISGSEGSAPTEQDIYGYDDEYMAPASGTNGRLYYIRPALTQAAKAKVEKIK